MRAPLLIALALALAATWWLQQGEDGGGVEVADRRGADRPRHAASGDARPARGSDARAPRETTVDAPAVAGAWLVDRVQAWQARRAQDEALPPARAMNSATPSAWSAALPPPPPPPPRITTDAAPSAPPFPHQWVGRFDDEPSAGTKAVRRAVISGPVSTWVAREGDVIEGQWRVDQIQERLMRLTYLPLQQSQTVAMK